MRHGVDVGDAQREADRGVGGRAAALAEDVGAAAELHDVVDDQEVAGEVLGLDDRQLVARSCATASGYSAWLP